MRYGRVAYAFFTRPSFGPFLWNMGRDHSFSTREARRRAASRRQSRFPTTKRESVSSVAAVVDVLELMEWSDMGRNFSHTQERKPGTIWEFRVNVWPLKAPRPIAEGAGTESKRVIKLLERLAKTRERLGAISKAGFIAG